jgi:hypothetical protein
MVVDTDASGGGGQSSSVMCSNGNCTATCQPAPACCEELCDQGEADICNTFECGNLPDDPCSGEIGAGKIYRADGTQCLPPPTPRFMTEADPNLADTFGCVGHVGTYGSGDEHPMEAMGLAVGPLDAPGECNEGFLRDDAILVVTFITDEEDIDKSPGGPTDWAQAIIDAKGGNKDAIVVLGLFGDNDQAGSICEPYSNGGDGAEPGVRLRQFTELFGARGFAGSVCADDYSSFFAEAVDIVDLACNEFEPAG